MTRLILLACALFTLFSTAIPSSAAADTYDPAIYSGSFGFAFIVQVGRRADFGLQLDLAANRFLLEPGGAQAGLLGSATWFVRQGWRFAIVAEGGALATGGRLLPLSGELGFFYQLARGTQPARYGMRFGLIVEFGIMLFASGQVPLVLDVPLDGGRVSPTLLLGLGLRAPALGYPITFNVDPSPLRRSATQ